MLSRLEVDERLLLVVLELLAHVVGLLLEMSSLLHGIDRSTLDVLHLLRVLRPAAVEVKLSLVGPHLQVRERPLAPAASFPQLLMALRVTVRGVGEALLEVLQHLAAVRELDFLLFDSVRELPLALPLLLPQNLQLLLCRLRGALAPGDLGLVSADLLPGLAQLRLLKQQPVHLRPQGRRLLVARAMPVPGRDLRDMLQRGVGEPVSRELQLVHTRELVDQRHVQAVVQEVVAQAQHPQCVVFRQARH
mmetsp:Transcript_97704/g.248278  ORF Transcript_97704/g.248278 Transcript_97704/m.248278 type:complete len:248 (+) Transcript_97704:131-874(+)